MGAKPRIVPRPKAAPTRIQVYLGREDIGAALDRVATAKGLSLSQAAAMVLEQGLRRRGEADYEDRLKTLEKRVAEQTRRQGRDLIIIEELLFIALRTLFSRMPEQDCERDPQYRAAIDHMLQDALNEVGDRLRTTRNARDGGPLEQDDPGSRDTIDPANDQGTDRANDLGNDLSSGLGTNPTGPEA